MSNKMIIKYKNGESQFKAAICDGTIVPPLQEQDVKIRYKKINKWGFEEEWETTFKSTKLSPMIGKEK